MIGYKFMENTALLNGFFKFYSRTIKNIINFKDFVGFIVVKAKR